MLTKLSDMWLVPYSNNLELVPVSSYSSIKDLFAMHGAGLWPAVHSAGD